MRFIKDVRCQNNEVKKKNRIQRMVAGAIQTYHKQINKNDKIKVTKWS